MIYSNNDVMLDPINAVSARMPGIRDGILQRIEIELTGKPVYSAQLDLYVTEMIGDLGSIKEQLSRERKNALGQIVDFIGKSASSRANLVFICTHNSRRSHFAQVWCQVALAHFGCQNVEVWSGGTQVTECNSRTIDALYRAGLKLVEKSFDDNPTYRLSYNTNESFVECYSKIYNQPPNPADNYIAILCCSDVDESCPVIEGALHRVSLHYLDPKVSDNTSDEESVYDERCLQIAREMFWLASMIEQ